MSSNMTSWKSQGQLGLTEIIRDSISVAAKLDWIIHVGTFGLLGEVEQHDFLGSAEGQISLMKDLMLMEQGL